MNRHATGVLWALVTVGHVVTALAAAQEGAPALTGKSIIYSGDSSGLSFALAPSVVLDKMPLLRILSAPSPEACSEACRYVGAI